MHGSRLAASSRRCAIACLASGIGVLVLVVGAGAYASGLNHLVPPNGRIEGKGYAYFLKRKWQIYFDASSSGPKPCQTVSVNDGQVAMIEQLGPGKNTCSEPAARPIYVGELAPECSTLPGDHGHFGTTDSQLERCARVALKGAVLTASIDGQPVAHFGRYRAATRVFSLTIPKNRFHGVTQRHARSAAYGYALLITGLRRGTHRLNTNGTFSGGKWESSLTLHVH